MSFYFIFKAFLKGYSFIKITNQTNCSSSTNFETISVKSETDCFIICSKKEKCAFVQFEANNCIIYTDLKCDDQIFNKNFWTKSLNSNNKFFDCSSSFFYKMHL